MKFLHLSLLILSLSTLSLASTSHLSKVLRPKYLSKTDKLCQYSPNFDYPLVNEVDKTLASIPSDVYPAKINTGYIPIDGEGSHIYYVLYPARGDSNANANFNNSAPLVMWMQGGPGCADWLGNFAEVGPISMVNTTDGKWKVVKTEVNWNSDYNLLFIDQPPGVGFSPAGKSNYTDSMQAGKTVVEFLKKFFGIYTSLKSNPFYIFGESYAGHYIPSVASQLAQRKSETGINLAGIGIGNGLTDPGRQVVGYSQFGYAAGILSSQDRDKLAVAESQVRREFAVGNWSGVSGLFDDIIGYIADPTKTGVFSPYDYRDGPSANLPSAYSFYLKDNNVRKAFAMDPSVKFADCYDPMYEAFYNDIGQSYAPNITYLLNQGVPVLLYNGQDDIIINNSGIRNFIKNLDWQYTHQFVNSLTTSFTDKKGNVLGTRKNFKQLSFVMVYKAGHAAPSYQPFASKLMLDNFIAGKI